MPVRVKICGITAVDDALAAVEAGAHALGFIFFSASPRYVAPALAGEIISSLPPFVSKVGVFVNASSDEIQQAARQSGIDTIQLHGDESPDFCAQFQLPVIKAARIKDESSVGALRSFTTARALLLDSYVPGQLGGTGERFNWDLAVQATKIGRPVILAGGLTPDNVAEAVTQVRPYGVDVSSGVELAPGRKDTAKVRRFIREVQSA